MATSVFDFWRVQSIVGDRSLAVIGSNLGGWFMPRPLPSRQAMENPMLDITLPLPYPQTPESARTLLRAYGVPVTELAREIGVDRMTVVDLLRGLGKGHRGKCHRAAIALGLKPDPKTLKRAA